MASGYHTGQYRHTAWIISKSLYLQCLAFNPKQPEYRRQDYLTRSREHKRLSRNPEAARTTQTSGTDLNATVCNVSNGLKHKIDDFGRERKLLKKNGNSRTEIAENNIKCWHCREIVKYEFMLYLNKSKMSIVIFRKTLKEQLQL